MGKIDIVKQSISDMSLDLIKILLKDKTTGKFILWATDDYKQYGHEYFPSQEITPKLIMGKNKNIIQHRAIKSQLEQMERTRVKAEVFTPSWICNKQNNLIDDAWFGRLDVFNRTEGTTWISNPEKISFPNDKNWQDYIDSKRLEVSCGEAPYLVSRYDTVTGLQISINQRIGLLDRKLRVVGENADNEFDWMKWVIRAYQSVYGYEWQGDNVLLARENLLLTFIDYYEERFGQKPTLMQKKKIANIISWNIWQMDGITMTVPFSEALPIQQQVTFFDFSSEINIPKMEPLYCRIFDWRANRSVEFRKIKNGG